MKSFFGALLGTLVAVALVGAGLYFYAKAHPEIVPCPGGKCCPAEVKKCVCSPDCKCGENCVCAKNKTCCSDGCPCCKGQNLDPKKECGTK